SLLNDDPQNAAARENLYYVLREQNKSAEAQAMLQTLPQSLRQKLQPRVVAGMPGDALRHNKDLPQAEQTLRSLLNDDPQNAAARENLYYVLREQNKSAEAQAM
ncbi:hypothetical protein CQA88_31530, partial [Klebsiella pneumoniae]